MEVGTARQMLLDRGIRFEDMAALVLELQRPYNSSLSLDYCLENVESIVRKREVQYAVITGVTLDIMAEEGTLQQPLQSIIREDNLHYGVDEVLALTIVNVYGSIGLSNFGYLSMEKPDFMSQLRSKEKGQVNTFLDDIVAAIVAATCARIAHRAGSSED